MSSIAIDKILKLHMLYCFSVPGVILFVNMLRNTSYITLHGIVLCYDPLVNA